jgi:hypothetical protein
MIILIDDFLSDFEAFNRYAREIDYSGVVNPVDGVMYPHISTEILSEVAAEVVDKVQQEMGQIVINTLFLRLTTRNTKGAPHQAHNDASMGDFSLMLYMQDGPGGTSFVEHIEEDMKYGPTEEQLPIWARDTNVPEAWKIHDMAEMKANRVCIFPSNWMHRAEPIGGFGESTADGRLVMTAFLS